MAAGERASTQPEVSDCVLALDVGTSSVRVGIYDMSGRAVPPVPTTRLAYRWRTTSEGGMEVPADDLFERTVAVIDAAMKDVRRAEREVVAVATATFWHSLLGIGAGGAPLTPLFGWGDTRAAGAAAILRRKLDPREVHQRTGCFLHPSYPSAKLLWLRETHPGIFSRVGTWIGFGEYLALRFFGEPCSSLSMASATGLLDLRRSGWDSAMLDILGIAADRLPPLTDLDTPLRGLRPEFARRWPELAEIPWFPALGDGACANIGSGAVGRGRIGLTVGTSAALRMLWEPDEDADRELPAGLWCYRLDARRWVAGGALSNGGSVVAHLERTLQLPPRVERDAALAEIGPDTHGLTVLPFLLGERSVGWHPAARAAIVGLTQDTVPLDIYRAHLEAVAYRLARVHDALDRAFGPTRTIFAGGGALHASPVWMQIIADVFGRPLGLPAVRETTARGVALAALESLGAIGRLEDIVVLDGPEFRPNDEHHARYRMATERQRALEEILLPWMAG